MTSFFLPKSQVFILVVVLFCNTHAYPYLYLYKKKKIRVYSLLSLSYTKHNILYVHSGFLFFLNHSVSWNSHQFAELFLHRLLQWIVFCMWMHHDLFQQVSVVGHLCCFQYFAFKNNASVNNFVYILGFFPLKFMEKYLQV